MPNYNSPSFESSSALYQVLTAGTGYTPGDIVELLFTQQGDALQTSQWFNHTTRQPISSPTITHLVALETARIVQSQDTNNLLTSLVSTSADTDFQNEFLLSQFGEAVPNQFDVVASIDMKNNAPYDWIMVSANSQTGTSPNLGFSVSTDGSTWDDLFSTGNFAIDVRDVSGNNVGATSFTPSPFQYYFVKPPVRFIRFLDIGPGQSYSLNVFSCKRPPFPDTSDVLVNNNLNVISQAVQFPHLETRDYVCLTASAGYAVGDRIRQLCSSTYSNLGNPTFVQWQNLTQKTFNLATPPLANIVSASVAEDSQNVIRFVNSNIPVIVIKPSNALVKSIYVDNFGALTYVGIHQGLATLPVTGAIPTESYRLPANGSISLEINRVYAGQVYLTFSSTPGAITTSSVNRNVIVSFN